MRGAFEYQGQKCSAASRLFIADNLWPELRDRLAAEIDALPVGDVRDFGNFMGAVIDGNSFKTQATAIDEAKQKATIVAGGSYDDCEGWFVRPTVVETDDPDFRLMKEELFGPVVTAFVYPRKRYDETLELIDNGSPYGLTGAVFARDRGAIDAATRPAALRRRQPLRQRQADRRGRRPAAVRRRARVRHERQGGLDVEPDPLGQPADGEGDLRAADRLPLSVHGSGRRGLVSNYAVARLDEIDEVNDGRCPWRPVRHHFGITSFGVNAWTARDAGDRIINEHDESEPDADEELYLVLRGRAAFELDGERVDAPAGTFVFARPGVKRTAFAEEPETTIIALGGTPGKAYEPIGWELWAPLNPLYEAGEYAEAADRGRELVEAHPQYAGLFYNVACCESLAGRTDDAIDHLRRAIELSERSRALRKGRFGLRPDPRRARVQGARRAVAAGSHVDDRIDRRARRRAASRRTPRSPLACRACDVAAARRVVDETGALPPRPRGPDRSRLEAAAAVRADVVEDVLDAGRAERALVGADPRVRRVGRQVLVAQLAVRSKLERHARPR